MTHSILDTMTLDEFLMEFRHQLELWVLASPDNQEALKALHSFHEERILWDFFQGVAIIEKTHPWEIAKAHKEQPFKYFHLEHYRFLAKNGGVLPYEYESARKWELSMAEMLLRRGNIPDFDDDTRDIVSNEIEKRMAAAMQQSQLETRQRLKLAAKTLFNSFKNGNAEVQSNLQRFCTISIFRQDKTTLALLWKLGGKPAFKGCDWGSDRAFRQFFARNPEHLETLASELGALIKAG